MAQAQVDHHNASLAVRAGDLIQLAPGRGKPKLGRGSHRTWLPQAALRVCFGLEPVYAKAGRRRPRKPQTTVAASTSVIAAVNRASGTHIKRLRDGVSGQILRRQEEIVSSAIDGAPYVIVVISLDETMEDVDVEGDLGPRNILMMHGRTMCRKGRVVHEHELIFPTAVLDDTTAETVLAALHDRAQLLFNVRPAGKLIVIINSDSAPSLKRMRRHFEFLAKQDGGKRLQVDSFCQMHLVCATIVGAFSPFGLVSPIFCATLQLHQGPRVASPTCSVCQCFG